MTTILRQPKTLEKERYDLIVIGGGIHGACMLLEASRRGWKTLLLERDDFGGATSFNSLRILHGGLRYLQSLDLARFRRSVHEQTWWLTNFHDLVETLPCLMPLYNQRLHRTDIVRCALRVNDFLAARTRRGTEAQWQLERSQILDVSETIAKYPRVNTKGLRGGALWFDVRMKSPQRLLMEVLRWSSACGGNALNYMECTGFDASNGRVSTVEARCRVSDEVFSFETGYVVNCAGPWLGEVSRGLHLDHGMIRHTDHAVAFNLVIHRAPPSACALAVAVEPGKSPTFFVVPYGDMTMVGTCHLAPQTSDKPSSQQITEFLDMLNLAVPRWELQSGDVQQVLSGRLPPQIKGSQIPAKSPRITHLAQADGNFNVTHVQGPKYTTARHTAQVALSQIAQRRGVKWEDCDSTERPAPIKRPDFSNLANMANVAQDLRQWIRQESIVREEDFLRRQDFTEDAFQHLAICLAELSDWPTWVVK